MGIRIGVFTIFTFLLFAVSTARLFDQVVVLTDGVSNSSPESVTVADSNIVLPNQKPKSEIDETTANDRLPEIEKTQTLDVSTIDPTQRLKFARLHPIKRHFFDKTTRIPLRFVRRHPCRKFGKTFMIPQTKTSYGNDEILSGKTYSFDSKTLGNDQVPTKWLEFKHNYGHHHHHHHQHHHDHHDEKDEEFVPKYRFERHHHKEKRENNGRFNFMKRIRKFLKHTFD